MKRNLLLTLFCLLMAASSYSQFSLGVHGGIAVPLGNLRSNGAAGFMSGIDLHYLITKKFSACLSLSYVPFGAKEETIGTNYYSKGQIKIAPLLVNAQYYLSTSKIKPFVGFGLGAYYTLFSIQNRFSYSAYPPSDLNVKQSKMYFGVSPKVGITFEVLPRFDIGLSTQLHSFFGSNYGNKNQIRSFVEVSLSASYRFGKN